MEAGAGFDVKECIWEGRDGLVSEGDAACVVEAAVSELCRDVHGVIFWRGEAEDADSIIVEVVTKELSQCR